jgi:very-short-patch-repair endonuclease
MRKSEKIRFARKLRRAATEPERVLWGLLRGRQLDGFKFRRQHSLESFIFDFYCPVARLAIELDGGGHVEPDQAAYDAERTRYLHSAGVRVLRFWNHEVLQQPEKVLDRIAQALRDR